MPSLAEGGTATATAAGLWSVDALVTATGGRLVQGGVQRRFPAVVTDSRAAVKDSVFVAIEGERLNGHAFIDDALKRACGGLIVRKATRVPQDVTVIKVPDTLRALGDIAHYHRERVAPKILAITGSNGKTTTKEMVYSILERSRLEGRSLRGKVMKTEGNFNNLVGLPLTLLRLRGPEKAVVVEIGTNRPGEIERLTEIADPDIGLITSVAAAHLSGLGTVAGVAREKGALFRTMNRRGTAVVNVDDARIRRMSASFTGRRVTYGEAGTIRAEHRQVLRSGRIHFVLRLGRERLPVRLALCGEHNLHNAVAAAAMAHALGVDADGIRRGLEAMRPVSMRMELARWQGVGIINDTYNANPASMDAALKTLREMPGRGRRLAVLGDMLEMGRTTERCHRELGRSAVREGVDGLYLLGEFAGATRAGALRAGMSPAAVTVGSSHRELGSSVRAGTRKGDWVLFKGSRGAAMEQVLAAFKGEGR